MTAQTNKFLVRRYYEEVLNQRQLAVIDELFSPDFISHPGGDLNGYRQAARASLTAFPDLHVTIEEQVAEGDLVATRWSARGTQQGPFGAIPPTGRSVEVRAMHFHRFVDGKIVEFWEQFDLMGALQQLGVLPPMALLNAQ
jgi:steroid delta-isomerase-like uncharacterized protein